MNEKRYFQKMLEQMPRTSQEKEKILNEKRIYLDDVIKLIDDNNIVQMLLAYEEQTNALTFHKLQLMYKAGFKYARGHPT